MGMVVEMGGRSIQIIENRLSYILPVPLSIHTIND